MKETFKEGEYKYIKKLDDNEHLLLENNTGNKEIWFNNLNHASYGLIYKNTHLEFARSYRKEVVK